TDWPHIKRAAFHQDIGYYREGVPMWACELDFARRVNRQLHHFVADISGLSVFKHIGAEHSFNTSSLKTRLAKRLERIKYGAEVLEGWRGVRAGVNKVK